MDPSFADELSKAAYVVKRHPFRGSLETARPLADLATVLDMTGLSLGVSRDGIYSNEPGVSLESHRVSANSYGISGDIDDARHDPQDVLSRLTMAMDADGIRFAVSLLDDRGNARVTYESDR